MAVITFALFFVVAVLNGGKIFADISLIQCYILSMTETKISLDLVCSQFANCQSLDFCILDAIA